MPPDFFDDVGHRFFIFGPEGQFCSCSFLVCPGGMSWHDHTVFFAADFRSPRPGLPPAPASSIYLFCTVLFLCCFVCFLADACRPSMLTTGKRGEPYRGGWWRIAPRAGRGSRAGEDHRSGGQPRVQEQNRVGRAGGGRHADPVPAGVSRDCRGGRPRPPRAERPGANRRLAVGGRQTVGGLCFYGLLATQAVKACRAMNRVGEDKSALDCRPGVGESLP